MGFAPTTSWSAGPGVTGRMNAAFGFLAVFLAVLLAVFLPAARRPPLLRAAVLRAVFFVVERLAMSVLFADIAMAGSIRETEGDVKDLCQNQMAPARRRPSMSASAYPA